MGQRGLVCCFDVQAEGDKRRSSLTRKMEVDVEDDSRVYSDTNSILGTAMLSYGGSA